MVAFPFTTAFLRFPRRNPLCLLLLLVPISLGLYIAFSPYNLWNPLRIISLKPPSTPYTPIPSSPAKLPPPTITAPSSKEKSNILLVSSFFPLLKSKHATADYDAWLGNFLGHISTDIYFYTTPEMETTVRELRGDLPLILNTSFASPFDIPPLRGHEDAYSRMRSLDHDKSRQSPESYATRSAKPFLLAEALRTTANVDSAKAKSYDFAFWTDATVFKEKHAYRDWPDIERVEEIWSQGKRESGMKSDELIFFPIQNLPHVSMLLWNDKLGPIDNDFSEGSFFGGKPKTIFWWEVRYYAYHDFYIGQGAFVGNDESMINSLFLLHPDRIITVWHSDPVAPGSIYTPNLTPSTLSGPGFREETREILGDCGEPWYYYEFFLASWREQEKMRGIWDAKWRWDFWRLSWWTRQRQSCRVTRVLAMEWLLRRPFGEMWYPPKATLEDGLSL